MRKIKCKVQCQYWTLPEDFFIEVEDGASDDEIEVVMLEAAINAANFNFWRSE